MILESVEIEGLPADAGAPEVELSLSGIGTSCARLAFADAIVDITFLAMAFQVFEARDLPAEYSDALRAAGEGALFSAQGGPLEASVIDEVGWEYYDTWSRSSWVLRAGDRVVDVLVQGEPELRVMPREASAAGGAGTGPEWPRGDFDLPLPVVLNWTWGDVLSAMLAPCFEGRDALARWLLRASPSYDDDGFDSLTFVGAGGRAAPLAPGPVSMLLAGDADGPLWCAVASVSECGAVRLGAEGVSARGDGSGRAVYAEAYAAGRLAGDRSGWELASRPAPWVGARRVVGGGRHAEG